MKKLYITQLNAISKIILLIVLITSYSATAQNFTDSKIPIVIITTDNDPNTGLPLHIVDTPKKLAGMKIIKRPDETRNFLLHQNTAGFLNHYAGIDIEITSSFTQTLRKEQYSSITLKANNSNNNGSIFGVPSENHWILNGLDLNPSLFRDYLPYLSGQLGNYVTKTGYSDASPRSIAQDGTYLNLESMTLDNKVDSSLVAASNNTLSYPSLLASSTLTIYPNPVSNVLRIEASKPMSGVKMFNVLGALVHEVKTDSESVNMDLSAHSSGIYFITIYNEDGFTSRKIIKK